MKFFAQGIITKIILHGFILFKILLDYFYLLFKFYLTNKIEIYVIFFIKKVNLLDVYWDQPTFVTSDNFNISKKKDKS